jgi:uncharacterized protein DUF4238
VELSYFMVATVKLEKEKFKPKLKRRDHYLPQGYLRGFVDPSRMNHQRPLWHLDVPNNVWSERSPREVGYRPGFYDYASTDAGLETADSTFFELESNYPRIRAQLISSNFEKWGDHRDFLLRYIQMMRARSLLFFDQKHEEGKFLQTFIVEEVLPDGKSVRVRSLVPAPPSDDFIRNRAISEMRAEIKKGAAWLNDFNWALRLCESAADPFIISEIPVMAYGHSAKQEEALQHPETLLFFPLCWQACLIGSRQFFEIETGKFGDQDMQRVRRMYRESAKLFLLSPRRFDDL